MDKLFLKKSKIFRLLFLYYPRLFSFEARQDFD